MAAQDRSAGEFRRDTALQIASKDNGDVHRSFRAVLANRAMTPSGPIPDTYSPLRQTSFAASLLHQPPPSRAAAPLAPDAHAPTDLGRNTRPYVADATDGFGVVLFGRPWQERC